jgi:hypothetical protein
LKLKSITAVFREQKTLIVQKLGQKLGLLSASVVPQALRRLITPDRILGSGPQTQTLPRFRSSLFTKGLRCAT